MNNCIQDHRLGWKYLENIYQVKNIKYSRLFVIRKNTCHWSKVLPNLLPLRRHSTGRLVVPLEADGALMFESIHRFQTRTKQGDWLSNRGVALSCRIVCLKQKHKQGNLQIKPNNGLCTFDLKKDIPKQNTLFCCRTILHMLCLTPDCPHTTSASGSLIEQAVHSPLMESLTALLRNVSNTLGAITLYLPMLFS